MILLFVKEEDGAISFCMKRDNEPFVAVPITQDKATALAHQLEAGVPTA